MVLEEPLLVLQGSGDRLGLVNVPLTSVDDRDIAETEGDNSASENIDNIGSLIHQVDFCKDTNGSRSLRIDFSSHFETIRVGQIRVRSSDGKDNSVRLGDEAHEHISDLLFDIAGLISDRDLGQTGQIDQRKGKNVGREDSQVDRVWRDSFV